MTDSNEQSNLLGNFMPPVSPGEYLLNKAKIAEAKALITAYEEMNEAGKQSHDDLARELEQKIREGEQARELLSRLGTQSTFQVPFPRTAIDYPLSTSRIEEVPNYDSSPPKRHSQQSHYQQFQGPSNQQTHNFVPQVPVQPVASSSYQQSSTQQQQQQWIPGNPNVGQSTQYSPYSPPQPPIMQNRSSSFSHQRPLPPKTSNTTSQLATALGPQPNASSLNSSPVAVTSPNPVPTSPIANPNGDRTSSSISNQNNVTQDPHPLLHFPTTLPSIHMHHTKFIRELKEAIKLWDAKSPPNSYYDHPSNYFRIYKDLKGVVRIIMHGQGDLKGQSRIVDIDQFFEWIRQRNQNATTTSPTTTSVTPAVPPNSQSGPSSTSTPSSYAQQQKATYPKAIPSTTLKANVQSQASSSSSSLSATIPPPLRRPEFLERGVSSSSKQTSTTLSSSSKQNQGTVHQMATPSAPPPLQTGSSSSSQIPNSVPQESSSNPLGRPLPTSSTVPPANSASVPKTPIRQVSSTTTMINGSPRSAKQADKRTLASHILFGLGKRRRNSETGPAAVSTEPQPKRHNNNTQQASGHQVVAKDIVGHSAAGYTVSQATPAVQKPNVPNGTSSLSSLSQQPFQPYYRAHVGPSASYTVDQATPVVQNPNVPVGASTASSYFQQPHQPYYRANVGPSASYTVGQATPAVQKPNVPDGASTTSSLQQPLTVPRETQQISQTLPASSNDQQQPVNVTIPSTSKVAAALKVPEVSKTSSLQDASTVPLATSTVVQVPTLPSPAVSIPVPSPLVSKETTQPVASTILEQPQPSTPAKLQFTFISGSGLGPSAVQTPQKNQPLFLPSPVSSPGMDTNGDVNISGTQSANLVNRIPDQPKFPRSAKRKKNYAFVLAPRRPPYLVKYFQLEKEKIGMRSSLSKAVAGEEDDFYNATEHLIPSYAERQVVQLACSRLQELSCKWDGCLVKMNSVDALIHHLNRQHKPRTSHSNFFLCRWTQCGRRCNFHEKHLEKHASLPLNCPYKDCEESFRSAPPLLKHASAEHEDDELKPSTQLRHPTVKVPDAVPLGVIPTYMITTRIVIPEEISSAWHAILAPRILRDISEVERDKSKNKVKRTVYLNGDINPPDEDSEDYDFLNARPTRYSSRHTQAVDMQLEDLNSENISKLVDEGLMLWGNERVAERRRPDVERELIIS